MILFIVALIPLLATVTCKPVESQRYSEVICDVFLQHGPNANHDLPHNCGKDERFKVSFIKPRLLEEKASILLFFEPKDTPCVEKMDLLDKKPFCEWKKIDSSTYDCADRPDYTTQWKDTGSTGKNGSQIVVWRSTKLQNSSGCE